MLSEYDFIIVGGGTAGLVLASRLVENPAIQVLVLEAGEDRRHDSLVQTPGLWPKLLGTSADWAFLSQPQTGLSGKQTSIVQGRILGGSSAINGHAFVPPPRSNVEAWISLGEAPWNWDEYLKSQDRTYIQGKVPGRLENCIRCREENLGGRLKLCFHYDKGSPWPQLWLKTMEALGIPSPTDPFGGSSKGGFIISESIVPDSKERSYAATAYLQPVEGKTNLTIWMNATVDKVIVSENSIATGVQCIIEDRTITVTCLQEVVLCAGAFNSPRILELSGIGDPEILRRHDIPIRIGNPNVGENLQNHVMGSISFEVQESFPTLDALFSGEESAIAAARSAYEHQEGPLSRGGSFAGAALPLPEADLNALKSLLEQLEPLGSDEHFLKKFLCSSEEASALYLASPGYVAYKGDGSRAQSSGGRYISIIVLLSHPFSRGSTHIADGSSKGQLDIDMQHLAHPVDVEVFARHFRYIAERLVHTEPLHSAIVPNGKCTVGFPGNLEDLDSIKEYLRLTSVGAHHYTSTCSMAPLSAGGVVDGEFRVHGCQNLRVCDASVIPLVPRANTQAAVYAIAEVAASVIKASPKCNSSLL